MDKKIDLSGGKIMTVRLSDLNIDASYQRGLKANRKRIRRDFNPAAVGVLHVGRRENGSLWLIDGQQRTWAMKEIGIAEASAFVVDSTGPEYEAIIFGLLNGQNRLKLNANELFNAAIQAKDPVAISAVIATEAAGFRLAYTKPSLKSGKRWPWITAVAAVYRMTKSYGEVVIGRALKSLAGTYPQQDPAITSNFVLAWLRMYGMHGHVINDERMVRQLSKVPPQKIINESAVTTQDQATLLLRTIINLYNKKLGHTSPNRIRLVVSGYNEEEQAPVHDQKTGTE